MESFLTKLADYLASQSWQIPIVFAIVAAACWGLRKKSAHWRYLLWLVVLAKCLTPAWISVPLAVLPQPVAAWSEPKMASEMAPLGRYDDSPVVANSGEHETAIDDYHAPAASLSTPQREVVAPSGVGAATAISIPDLTWREWLTVAWLGGIGLFFGCVSLRAWAMHRSLRRMRCSVDGETAATVAALAEKFGLRAIPPVYSVDGIAQPFVWGWFRGSIYLPQSFIGSGVRRQRQAILTHELAHVVRWDAAANLVQIFVQAVFFFHPLVWLANRQIRREREKCCDEMVIAGLGADPKQYGEAIVKALVAEYQATQAIPSLAVAGRLKNIEQRIQTLLSPHRRFFRRPSATAVATAALAAALLLPTALVLTARGGPADSDSAGAPSHASAPAGDDAAKEKDKPAPPSPPRAGSRQSMALTQGPPLEGTVTDRDGKPIVGAWVGQGEDRCVPYTVETRTDSQGRYRFAHCNPGWLMLTVVAPGYSPELHEVSVAKDMKPVDFRLSPGKTLRIRVVDTAGRPIAGAGVVPDTWRGHRTLHFLGLPKTTDAEGRWAWDGAPADALLCDVYCQGSMSCRKRSLVATDDEHTIVLRPPQVVSGRVSDAVAGKPVPEFSVLPGIESDTPRPHSLSWDHRRSATIGREGRYSITITEPAEKRLIRIDAPGYLPEISRAIGNDEGNVTIDFELKKTASVAALTPQDKPAAGATVVVCTPQGGAYIDNGAPPSYGEQTKTNAEGRFSIAPQDNAFFLLIFHGSGFACVTQEQWKRAEPIHLNAWARVEGVCRVHGRPAAEQVISIRLSRESDRNAPNFFCDYHTTTDKEGRFTFERVIPGHGQVNRLIVASRGTSRRCIPADSTEAVFVAGQTTQVEIARRGRPVVGRFCLPKAAEITPDWWHSLLSIRSIAPGSLSSKPGVSVSAKFEWDYSFKFAMSTESDSPEHDLSFGAEVESDGSFRFEDVPAGDYELTVRLDAPPKSSRADAPTEVIGSASHKFHVPEMPDGHSDEPLELGALELTLLSRSGATPKADAPQPEKTTGSVEKMQSPPSSSEKPKPLANGISPEDEAKALAHYNKSAVSPTFKETDAETYAKEWDRVRRKVDVPIKTISGPASLKLDFKPRADFDFPLIVVEASYDRKISGDASYPQPPANFSVTTGRAVSIDPIEDGKLALRIHTETRSAKSRYHRQEIPGGEGAIVPHGFARDYYEYIEGAPKKISRSDANIPCSLVAAWLTFRYPTDKVLAPGTKWINPDATDATDGNLSCEVVGFAVIGGRQTVKIRGEKQISYKPVVTVARVDASGNYSQRQLDKQETKQAVETVQEIAYVDLLTGITLRHETTILDPDIGLTSVILFQVLER